MDQGVPPPYQPPPLFDTILRSIGEPELTEAELTQFADKDPWYQKTLAKIAELKNRPPVTKAQTKEAWLEVVKKYWIWINLSTEMEDRQELIKEYEMEIRRRMIDHRRIQTLKKVRMVRRKLGYRYQL